jgi:hypothetical protein
MIGKWEMEVLFFVCCMLGKGLIRSSDKFPKFEKNEIRMLRPPLKDLLGLV